MVRGGHDAGFREALRKAANEEPRPPRAGRGAAPSALDEAFSDR